MSREIGTKALSPHSNAGTRLPLIQVVGTPSWPLTRSPTQRRPQLCSAHATLITGLSPSSPPCSCSSLLLLPTRVLHHGDCKRNLRRCLLFILILIVIFFSILKHTKNCSSLPAPHSYIAKACVFSGLCSSSSAGNQRCWTTARFCSTMK